MNLEFFNTASLFDAATNLFQQLGIKLNSNTAEALPARDLLKDFYKDNDTFNAIKTVYFIGLIDDSVFRATGMFDVNYSVTQALEQADRHYDGLMLFALELDKQPNRTKISDLTRAFNRISQKMPVALVLKYSIDHETVISIAISERFKYLQNWRQGEKVGKVIILKDIHTKNTHAGHQRILLDLVRPAGVTNYAQLHAQWLDVLDVNILNKRFFQELANWYFWAMDHVQFPDDIEKHQEKRNSTNLIRLITRVIFIWFIKEKHLVPASLFNQAYLKRILKDFRKDENSNNFYKAILQNLFFATINQKMGERDFADDHAGFNKEDQGIKTKYRYPDKFNISKKEILEIFKDIPFLNGGLFDCLDKFDEEKLEKGKKEQLFTDGFTRIEGKQAIIPDFLFFGEETEVDLTQYFDPEAKKAIKRKVKGLIYILDNYKFTVAENTPLEEEIALDPELLGKVFENLLASYNPETKTTARKQTGSFYTPREIVNYMVDESLIEYLKQNAEIKTDNFEAGLRNLFSYHEEGNPFNPRETDDLIKALNNAKILDPACGSGAFPMGMLHKMVHLLKKLDPGNKKWKTQQREKIIGAQIKELEKDKKAIEGLSDKAVRDKAIQAVEERLHEVEEVFESKNFFDDYARKLYLIENCIYGIDIQPIAVQISKLRFFISLIIDQDKDSNKENLGFRSLPNLETKFVAANTLIGLEIPTTDLFSENDPIKILQEQLKATRHAYFNAKTRKEKLRLQQQDKELRLKIASQISDTLILKKAEEIKHLEKQLNEAKNKFELIKEGPEQKEIIETENLFGQTETKIIDKKKEKIKDQKSTISNIEKQIRALKSSDNKDAIKTIALQISSFDPYDQNHFANWFESEWMFGNDVKDGFDVVIGNPPYVEAKKLKDISQTLRKFYTTYSGTADLYVYFYENGIINLKPNGTLVFITSNKFIKTSYGENLRKYFTRFKINEIVDFTDIHVFDALVASCILSVTKKEVIDHEVTVAFANDTLKDFIDLKNFVDNNKFYLNQANLNEDIWQLENETRLLLKSKIEKDSITINQTGTMAVYRGVTTGYNPAFIIDDEKRKELLIQDKANVDIIKPILQGRNIQKWIYNSSNEFLIQTGYDIPINEDFPSIFKHLNNYKKELEARADQGINWWNLRACKYYSEFENKKIIWGLTADKWNFAYDDSGNYLPSNGYILTSKEIPIKYLLALLNSRLMEFYFGYIGIMTAGGAYTLKYETVVEFPIKIISEIHQRPFIILVDYILTRKKHNSDTILFERLIDAMVYELYLPEEIKSGGADVSKYLDNLPELEEGKDEKNLKIIEKVNKELSDPKHPIGAALLSLLTIDEINIIEGRV